MAQLPALLVFTRQGDPKLLPEAPLQPAELLQPPWLPSPARTDCRNADNGDIFQRQIRQIRQTGTVHNLCTTVHNWPKLVLTSTSQFPKNLGSFFDRKKPAKSLAMKAALSSRPAMPRGPELPRLAELAPVLRQPLQKDQPPRQRPQRDMCNMLLAIGKMKTSH